MSGPALRKVDSHSLIHQAALGEARELTNVLERFLVRDEMERALEVAYITLEHWESRTLQHAQSEEEGLYKEIAESHSELRDHVIALTRDHQLMRKLVAEIKELLSREGVTKKVLERFTALIIVDEMHNHDEESMIGQTEQGAKHAAT
ncbi:Hemerythrin HHE cation binding domain-containing protein [Fontibacillus panacisegetis]|uniref:Hemerythrin HHE cation binding domain-containing protein n=1 Tax=Fontibacillus panacisegetis TaxID=670482 RepID=A0A1G7E9T9_9BACL|nr:hemerythrin domain-containing protein [Fontibacillus panacisegetis]SDE60330.1 Hemerythrin HHE cation binding domain-containing protein [Fontibacillus panacisegetis]